MDKTPFRHKYNPLFLNSKDNDRKYEKSREVTPVSSPDTIVGSFLRSFHIENGLCRKSRQNSLADSGKDRLSPGGSTHFSSSSPDDNENLYCNLEESPFYIFKASAQGLTEVVERLLNDDPKKIKLTDAKGWTCLHHAAGRGKVVVIDLLLKRGADINAKDLDDNTPLHIAVEKNQKESINRLLTAKADTKILNSKSLAPLHLAVTLNRPKLIEEMVKFPDLVDVEYKGHLGKRAIHLAATLDNWECAEALLKAGSKLCESCDNGFLPLHLAAKSASCKTISIMVQKVSGEEAGYSKEDLMEWTDKESNSPLHLAVNSGDIDTVRTCLDFGAKVDALQENKSTALHFACAQGALPVVQLLLETHLDRVPETGTNILMMKDILNMTPLHRAAMYDHAEVVRYLVEQQRATLDELDDEHRSPLLLAAIRGGSRSFCILLEAGSDIQMKDNFKRNVLHYLVTYAIGQVAVIPEIELICKTEDGLKLLNQKDVDGCTPLHLATKEGNIRFTEALIKLGAIVNLKDNEDQSPLHFAARYGRYNTVRRLLESDAGPNIINESDGVGMTALHIASMNGHTNVVQLLLHKGALIHKDYLGRSPLHLAAGNGYTQTVKMLLSFHSNLLDQTCKQGNTPLHSAAEANQSSVINHLLSSNCKYLMNVQDQTALDIVIDHQYLESALVIVQHERLEELLHIYNLEKTGCPLLRLIQHLPDAYKAILDRCHTKSPGDRRAKTYWEKFDFRWMQVTNERRNEMKELGLKPLFALNTMVEFGRAELLSHPLCLTYLNMKWLAYGYWFFVITITLYMTFIVALTKSVINLHYDFITLPVNETTEAENQATNESIALEVGPITAQRTVFCSMALVYVFIFAAMNMVKELVQIYQQRWHYFLDTVNYMEWSLYATAMLFTAPTLFKLHFIYRWEYGSLAVFIAWFNLLLYLQRLDTVGLYVVMFGQILQTILKVVFVFSVLFIAFGLTFYVLLWEDVQGGFRSPLISVLHSIMFMMGDWNYVEVFAKPYFRYPGSGKLSYPSLSFLFLILFVILMPILFINLLIGLAVGDIELVQKNASLKRLAMQVNYHTELEEKLPAKLIEKVDRTELVIYPNGCVKSSIFSTVLNKFRCMCGGSSVNSSSSSDSSETPPNDGVLMELNKSKQKLKEMQNQLDRMHDLLRLVVQKMDITEESDFNDEPMRSKPKEEPKIMTKGRTLRLKAKLAPIVAAKKMSGDHKK